MSSNDAKSIEKVEIFNYIIDCIKKGQSAGVYDLLESRNLYECIIKYKNYLEAEIGDVNPNTNTNNITDNEDRLSCIEQKIDLILNKLDKLEVYQES